MVRVDAAMRGWQATRRLGPAAGDATAGEESAPAALVVAKPLLQPRTSGSEALCVCCKRPAAACRWRWPAHEAGEAGRGPAVPICQVDAALLGYGRGMGRPGGAARGRRRPVMLRMRPRTRRLGRRRWTRGLTWSA
jgi:hypothetical protein